ncbi:MAG: hypothetical protein Q8O46_01885 [bacterium]|nr:hypothetical protein [bacterium]
MWYNGSQAVCSPKFGAREARESSAGISKSQEFKRICQDFFGENESVRAERMGFYVLRTFKIVILRANREAIIVKKFNLQKRYEIFFIHPQINRRGRPTGAFA